MGNFGFFQFTEENKLFFFMYGISIMILLIAFLLLDLFDSFLLFRCPGWKAKLVAFIIFMLTLNAIIVSCFGILVAGTSGFLDTFFVVVGISFVHGLDEAVGKFLDNFHAVKLSRLEICSFSAILFITCIFIWVFSIYIQDHNIHFILGKALMLR